LALFSVTAAVSIVMGSQTALLLAFPAIERSLRATPTDVQWIVDIYSVVLAALLLPAGTLGDRFGRRRVLQLGMVTFTLGNVGIALAPNVEWVIVLRIIAAVGCALAFPATLATITTTFPSERRARGVATWTAAAAAGGFGGAMLSGLLLEVFTWRSISWASAAAGAVVVVLVRLSVAESAVGKDANVDPIGAALIVTSVGALIYGIIESPTYGLNSPLIAGVRGHRRHRIPPLGVAHREAIT
jgi:MFS family permease